MQPIIKLNNTGVTYGKGTGSETVALRNVNLEIFDGEYIVFFGPSGCGKSTLLYTIAGLETPTEGSISVDSNDLRTMGLKEKVEFYRKTIGMVFQAFYLVPQLSARDNMMLSMMFAGVAKGEREAKAEELIHQFGITSYAEHRPSAMSGGQQQRVAIARALMNDPRIILADEPVGNLDSKNSEIVLELLADIHRNHGKTIIQVTHNPRDIHYADRVFYIKDGAIERVVANTERGMKVMGNVKVGVSAELDKLTKLHPHLAPEELRALFVVRHALNDYSIDTEQKIVEATVKLMRKEFTVNQLVSFLDDEQQGAGLNRQKATSLAHTIDDLVKDLELKNSVKHPLDAVYEHLMKLYSGHLSEEQRDRLRHCINLRLSGSISPEEFQVVLDRPLADDGVGLNSRTAKHFAEEINFLLT